jgi:hypothetical protein
MPESVKEASARLLHLKRGKSHKLPRRAIFPIPFFASDWLVALFSNRRSALRWNILADWTVILRLQIIQKNPLRPGHKKTNAAAEYTKTFPELQYLCFQVPLLLFIADHRTTSTTTSAPSPQHERHGEFQEVSCSASKGKEGEHLRSL